MQFTIKMTGTTPLIMHNERLADPDDPITVLIKEISDKKPLTDVERRERERLEFMGGLYHDSEIGIHVPAKNVMACLEESGKITRKGTALLRAISPEMAMFPLSYPGRGTPEKLWEDLDHRSRMMVKVDRKKIVRVRPVFRKWSVEFHGEMIEDAGLNKRDLVSITNLAGRSIGLGDARKKLGFGRFAAEVAFGNGTV